MSIELKVPDVGESIQEVQIRKWLKQEGDDVKEDEEVVELETDKASVDLPAPKAGVLQEILVQEGETAQVGDVLAILKESKAEGEQDDGEEAEYTAEDTKADEKEAASAKDSQDKSKNGKSKQKAKKQQDKKKEKKQKQKAKSKAETKSNGKQKQEPKELASQEKEQDAESTKASTELVKDHSQQDESSREAQGTPAARREMRRFNISATEITPRGDRIRPEDVHRHLEEQSQESEGESEYSSAATQDDSEEVVPMSFLRQKIAERLVDAQRGMALLTTFNEIDMSAVMELRKDRGEAFQEQHGVKLGFMSFFIKATVEALKQQPMVNAEVRDGDKIAYFNNYHIGIAIGSSHGLVVPVLRNADQMSFAELERAIDKFAQAAEEETLQPADLQGGTFTISNGGIYGSLLSTPIVNPPQCGVLGMHQIQDRAVVRDQEVVIRPMMYVALSYDHRIIDGKEAVTFLRTIKETIEDPLRMLLDQ